jgi:hypothetical protein
MMLQARTTPGLQRAGARRAAPFSARAPARASRSRAVAVRAGHQDEVPMGSTADRRAALAGMGALAGALFMPSWCAAAGPKGRGPGVPHH